MSMPKNYFVRWADSEKTLLLFQMFLNPRKMATFSGI